MKRYIESSLQRKKINNKFSPFNYVYDKNGSNKLPDRKALNFSEKPTEP